MKLNEINCITLLVSLINYCSIQSVDSQYTNGMKHYWKFDGNSLKDEISGGEMLNNFASSFVKDRFSILNSALSLTNGNIQLPTSGISFDGSADFTIMFWFNPSSSTSAPIIHFANSIDTDEIKILYDTIKLQMSASNGALCLDVISTVSVTPNTWQHLAFTLNNPIGTIYKDGVNIKSNVASCPLNNKAIRSKNFLGKFTTGSGNINAQYDELKIFKRGMTQAEIAAEMNKTTLETAASIIPVNNKAIEEYFLAIDEKKRERIRSIDEKKRQALKQIEKEYATRVTVGRSFAFVVVIACLSLFVFAIVNDALNLKHYLNRKRRKRIAKVSNIALTPTTIATQKQSIKRIKEGKHKQQK